jgi:rod shape-determining protein MreC
MGVITPEGVVGKVVEVYDSTAEVLLLTDKDSGVGAMLSNSRKQSPVGGAGEPLLVMKYVANEDVVNVGERVVTSGMDKIFPRDLPIGTITDIKPGNPFKSIRIRPLADLERLEEVIVLLTLQPLQLNPETETAKPSASVAGKPVGEPTKSPSDGAAAKHAAATLSPAKPAAAPTPSTAVPDPANAAAVKPE